MPVEPLAELVDGWGLCRLLGQTRYRAYRRACAEGGLTWGSAEKLAEALGYHPTQIWGWDLYYPMEDDLP